MAFGFAFAKDDLKKSEPFRCSFGAGFFVGPPKTFGWLVSLLVWLCSESLPVRAVVVGLGAALVTGADLAAAGGATGLTR